jgi:hypothetical protein
MKRILPFLLLLLPGVALADPFSAIAAIGSWVGGAAAGMTLATGLTYAGAALSVVGAVTGNKKLTKIGGVMGLAGGFTSLLKSGLEAAGSAGAGAGAGAAPLGQTVISPAAEQAAGAAAGAATEMTVEQALTAAQNAGLGTDDLVQAATQSAADPLKAAVGAMTESPVKDAVSKAITGVKPPTPSLLENLASGIKNNKELVKIGAGLVSGAMQGRQANDLQRDREAEYLRYQQRYSDSVKGVKPLGQFIRPNVDVTNTPVRDPMRYVPQRGLVNRRP